jgi:hypothetical protein
MQHASISITIFVATNLNSMVSGHTIHFKTHASRVTQLPSDILSSSVSLTFAVCSPSPSGEKPVSSLEKVVAFAGEEMSPAGESD